MKKPNDLLFNVKVVVAGLAIFLALLGPLLWVTRMNNIDLKDFEGAPLQRIRTEISNMQIRPSGKHTVMGRPRIYVRVAGENLIAGGVTTEVYSQARVGLPVIIEYRTGKSGRKHVFKTEKWRPLEPGMVRAR
jgi:hypothetical protein